MKPYVRVLLICLLSVCVYSPDSIGGGWSNEDRMHRFLNQTHHWGQKGEISPNNGWSDYNYLRLEFGENTLLLHGYSGELLVEQLDNGKNPRLSALSIPRAGMFLFPVEGASCAPNFLEQVGIYAEFVLSLLGGAFQSGPQNAQSGMHARVKRPSELRFMQAVSRNESEAWFRVELKEVSPMTFEYDISAVNGPTLISGEWKQGDGEWVVQDAEPVSEWLTCWFGSQTLESDGSGIVNKHLDPVDDLKTFGDIRRALRSRSR